MDETNRIAPPAHDHVFLGREHRQNEQRSWIVIWLCLAMMALEIGGGLWFGSIALVADGLHMSTHAGALLLAALAYRYARRHADDPRFSFGTGKLGDLAGFASAIILAMISLLIGFEAIERLLAPVPIRFAEAIPIAGLGLVVNLVSAWLLSGGHDHDHGHSHGHAHGHAHHHDDPGHEMETQAGRLRLEIFEDGVPPRFRLHAVTAPLPAAAIITLTRPDGAIQTFALAPQDTWLESGIVPEPHEFRASVAIGATRHEAVFSEAHASTKAERDNNMRAAIVHVAADAAVSLMVIIGLILARLFGWVWMDPLAGMIGAVVIATWALGLIRDTGAILLDMTADGDMAEAVRRTIEAEGDTLSDLHLWRLGPGHLGAILCVGTRSQRSARDYQAMLQRFKTLSHVTVEVRHG
jgi:cation diffusion facilitator family transporter